MIRKEKKRKKELRNWNYFLVCLFYEFVGKKKRKKKRKKFQKKKVKKKVKKKAKKNERNFVARMLFREIFATRVFLTRIL